jgi:C1A family cysteine protease
VLCPFDGVYDDRIRDEAYAEGKEHTAQGSHSVLTTPEQMIQFMGAVSPTIQMGIPVGSKFENSTGVLSIQDVIADSRNPLGLHALAVIGYVQPATLRGLNLRPAAEEPHFIGQNSWSERYGFHGFFFMSLSAMRHVCNLAAHHQAEIAGICNQKTFDDIPPKDIDISDIFDIAA